MMQFNADLYRIAAAFGPKEETRYYLQGVFIEPCKSGGVTMTATDGTRLFCVRDEFGQADQSGIVRLSPEAMKLCRSKANTATRVRIEGQDATIERQVETTEDWQPIGLSGKVFIDGTFPDYRRIVPTRIKREATNPGHSWFAGRQTASFADAAMELEKLSGRGSTAALCWCTSDANSPALVLFGASPHAFGVLMPVRGNTDTAPPAWFLQT